MNAKGSLSNNVTRFKNLFISSSFPKKEPGQVKNNFRELLHTTLDKNWFVDCYRHHNKELCLESALDYYLDNVLDMALNPNPYFDEQSYRDDNPDVHTAIKKGSYLCGFEHYLRNGKKEKREIVGVEAAQRALTWRHSNSLETKIPGITKPVLLENCQHFFPLYNRQIKYSFADRPKTLNVVVPHIEVDILFGGYTAFFEFLRTLDGLKIPLRFIVTESIGKDNPMDILGRLSTTQKNLRDLLQHSEVRFLALGEHLTLGKQDRYIAYSSATARIAKKFADESNGEKFFFFIQEYEPIFYTHCSTGWFYAEPFYYDYVAIFNSPELKQYFLSNGIHNNPDALYFQHAITSSPRSLDEFNQGAISKKVFVYARPESHAERNMFELSMKIIDECFRQNILDAHCQVVGVGSLGVYSDYTLPCGKSIELRPRMSKEAYYAYIKRFDIGLSLINAPHPGVVHYELAASGVVAVTNQYSNRCRDSNFREGNIIFAKPTLNHILTAMQEAVALSENVHERCSNQQMQLARSWNDAYSGLSHEVSEIFHTVN